MQGNLEIIGFSLLSMAAEEAHVLNVGLIPEVRGKGFGKQLLLHLIDLAEQHKTRVIYLEVRDSNDIAKNLYASLQFEQVGVRKDYYITKEGGREDAIVLSRP